jgi:hypothetical protein
MVSAPASPLSTLFFVLPVMKFFSPLPVPLMAPEPSSVRFSISVNWAWLSERVMVEVTVSMPEVSITSSTPEASAPST